MIEFFKYLLFCEHVGLLIVAIFVLGLIILIWAWCKNLTKHKAAFFLGLFLVLVGVIGFSNLILYARQEVSGDPYYNLVKKAAVVPKAHQYLHQHLRKHGFVNRIDYCILMHQIKNDMRIEMKKKIRRWNPS